MPTLLIKRLDPRATIPAYHSDLAAGLDIAACLPPDKPELALNPRQIARIETGLALAIPPGHEGQVRPRSGLASRHGVTLPNSPGTIDADYRGQLIVPLINLGPEPYTITHGDRIAQLIIAPIAHVQIQETPELDPTPRGQAGFGSTGQ